MNTYTSKFIYETPEIKNIIDDYVDDLEYFDYLIKVEQEKYEIIKEDVFDTIRNLQGNFLEKHFELDYQHKTIWNKIQQNIEYNDEIYIEFNKKYHILRNIIITKMNNQ